MIGTVVFDRKLKRPACVLLQAVFGGTVPNFQRYFPSETWLLAPTPNMRMYRVENKEQLEALSAMAVQAVKDDPDVRRNRNNNQKRR